ncbi:MAG TPA: hypothetical protein VIH07_00830 [Candidatus Humimicrobiaceae bacterium]
MIKLKVRRAMKRFLIILFIIVFTLSILFGEGCKKADESSTDETVAQETTTDETTTDEVTKDETTDVETTQNTEVDSSTASGAEDQLIDYSIKINNEVIAIFDWDNEIDLYKILGDPISEDVQILGEGSDTFRGSFIKTLKYEGLEIMLFSPPDNGITFWILDIKVYNDLYSTSKNIKVGDSLETLKNRYPSITKVLDGRNDDNNCAYEIADRGKYLFLQFEVKDSVIQQIHIFHLIP